MDGDDVGVLQVGGGFGLAQKSFDLVRAGQGAGADHFQGHVPIQTRLPGLPDDSHAAPGDLFEKLVVAKILQTRPGLGGDRGCRRGVERAVAADSRTDWPGNAALRRHAGHRPWGPSLGRGLPHCGQMRAVVMVFAFRGGCFRLHLYQKQPLERLQEKADKAPTAVHPSSAQHRQQMTQLVLDIALAHRRGNPGPHQLAVAVAQPMDGHLDRPFASP